MRVGPFVLSLLVIASTSSQLSSQQSASSPQRDPQAIALLQQALTATSGTAQPAPTSIVASGTYTRFLADSTVSYPLRVEALGFDRFRWEIDTPDEGTIMTIVSGTASWSLSSQGTAAIPIAEIPGKTFESFPILALSTWANSPTAGLKMIGPETLAGRAVYHVSVAPTLAGNTNPNREKVYDATHQREIFFDQETNLLFHLRYYRHPTDWRVGIPVDAEYSNFQTIAGISFPMTIATYLDDQKITQIQYQSLTLNTSIPASDFLQGAPQ